MKIIFGEIIFLKENCNRILYIQKKFPKWKNLPSKKLLGQSILTYHIFNKGKYSPCMKTVSELYAAL